MAAALPGVVAAYMSLPAGTFAVGEADIRNEAILAARIRAFSDNLVAGKLEAFKQNSYRL